MKASNIPSVKIRRAMAAGALALMAALAGFAAKAASQPTGLIKVRFGGDQQATRVVLELDRSVQAKLIDGAANDVVLDLPRIKPGDDVDGAGRGLVKGWSVETRAGSTRLHLTLSQPADIERRFMLAPGEGVSVYRYVIDLKPKGAAAQPVKQAAATPARSAPAPARLAPQAKPGFSLVSRAEASAFEVRSTPNLLRHVVVIDAGHGGHDPGAMSSGTHEKDLTLAAALALKAKLESTGHYKVVLTRDSDVFVPLENRVQIARRANADLFISLHADAGPAGTRGASVYTLSDQGSRRVVSGVTNDSNWYKEADLPGATQAVRDILHDLTQRATRNRSAQFAEMLVDRLTGKTELLTRAHRDAGYMVLLAPDVPAVLLEMGFVTNASDARDLADEAKRARLTSAIASAIDDYFDAGVRIAME